MLISSLSETAARYLIQIIAADQKPPRNQQQFYQSFQQFLMKKKMFNLPNLSLRKLHLLSQRNNFSSTSYLDEKYSIRVFFGPSF